MTRFSDDDLEKMLREPDITSPPEGLLEAIKKEIPEHTAPMPLAPIPSAEGSQSPSTR